MPYNWYPNILVYSDPNVLPPYIVNRYISSQMTKADAAVLIIYRRWQRTKLSNSIAPNFQMLRHCRYQPRLDPSSPTITAILLPPVAIMEILP